MKVNSFESIVENGRIRLPDDVNLPNKTKVYVVILDLEANPAIGIHSPRLAHPEQIADFKMEVIEAPVND